MSSSGSRKSKDSVRDGYGIPKELRTTNNTLNCLSYCPGGEKATFIPICLAIIGTLLFVAFTSNPPEKYSAFAPLRKNQSLEIIHGKGTVRPLTFESYSRSGRSNTAGSLQDVEETCGFMSSGNPIWLDHPWYTIIGQQPLSPAQRREANKLYDTDSDQAPGYSLEWELDDWSPAALISWDVVMAHSSYCSEQFPKLCSKESAISLNRQPPEGRTPEQREEARNKSNQWHAVEEWSDDERQHRALIGGLKRMRYRQDPHILSHVACTKEICLLRTQREVGTAHKDLQVRPVCLAAADGEWDMAEYIIPDTDAGHIIQQPCGFTPCPADADLGKGYGCNKPRKYNTCTPMLRAPLVTNAGELGRTYLIGFNEIQLRPDINCKDNPTQVYMKLEPLMPWIRHMLAHVPPH